MENGKSKDSEGEWVVDLEDPDESFLDREKDTEGEIVDVEPRVVDVHQLESDVSSALVPTTTYDRYLVEVRRYPYLSKEEEIQLFHEYLVEGDRKAAIRLILANLRVSVAIAGEYRHTGADLMDLIQEGNVGLLQAINKFDVARNVRFYAYAAWWVRAYILRYLLNTHRLVKIGTTQEQRKLFYNLKKEKAKLEQQGFVPDAKLLADRLQVRERDVVEMDQRLGGWELSLDQPINTEEEGGGTYLDLLPSGDKGIEDELAEKQLRLLFRKKLGEFAETLNEREEDILRNRLLSETPLTLEELGKKYPITKERSRQLEAKIIKRLREYMQTHIKDFERLRF
jgi:RNA polymerase sigma-32 factor